MKRGTIFLTAFLSAAITFGSLMVFVGPQNSGWNSHRYGWHDGWRHHYRDYYNNDRFEHNNSTDTSRNY